jgi:hypothetical protein
MLIYTTSHNFGPSVTFEKKQNLRILAICQDRLSQAYLCSQNIALFFGAGIEPGHLFHMLGKESTTKLYL